MLHQSPNSKPKAVGEGEVILNNKASINARIRVGPLIWGKPRMIKRIDCREPNLSYLATTQIVRETRT